MARGNRLRVRIEEDVKRKLKRVEEGLRGREIPRIMHAGAVIVGAPAKAAAPVAEGRLRAGVYVTSRHNDGFQQISRGGRRLNSPLKRPASKRQALVVASTYYTRFVEYGRKTRVAEPDAGNKRLRRGVGRLRKRPFFMRTVRRWKRPAQEVIRRQVARLIEREWQR